MKYFEVETKCGHVGRRNCIFIKFAIEAENGKEAAAKARRKGRVKHNHKDAIKNVKQIAVEEFQLLLQQNKTDKYLNCRSRHEQNKIDISDRIVIDEYNYNRKIQKKTRNAKYKVKKNNIQEKSWIKFMYDCSNEFLVEIA